MVAVVSTLVLLAGLLVRPAPSYAYSQWGCDYPYACVYNNTITTGSIVGRFRDVTSYFQTFGPRTAPFGIVNTRNDDTVYYLHNYPGEGIKTYCLLPNDNISYYGGRLHGIRIDSRSYCASLNG